MKQGSSGPSFHFMADEGKFKFHYTNNDYPDGVTSPYFEAGGYTKGVWYDFVLEYLPQYTSNGYFKFYYKKASESSYTLLEHYTGSTLVNDKDGYIKWGIYKSTWARNPTDSTLRIVHHDNIKVATTFAEVSLPALQTPYEAWYDLYDLPVAQTGMLANADGDARNNLYEYAIGANPTNDIEVAGILPGIGSLDASTLEFIYRRRTDRAARSLTYAVECTTNLISNGWTTNGVSETGFAPLETGFESVTNEISTSSEDEQFVRLKIESL